MKTILARIGIALVIGLAILVVLKWSMIQQFATFSPIFMPRSGPAPADEAEARLQDLEYLAKFLDYDRSFDETARIEFEQLIESGKANAAAMSLADLYLLGSKATALADNGHTGFGFSPVRDEFNYVGVRYFYFKDGLYIVWALAEHEQLIGGRVIEIDGQPIDAVLAALNVYTGGNAAWRRLHAVMMLESAKVLYAAGLVESSTGYSLIVEDQTGSRLEVYLPAFDQNADGPRPTGWAWMTLEAAAWPAEGDEWVHTLQARTKEDLPLYLQNMRQRYMWKLLDSDGGYLRIQETLNTKEQTLAAFIDENLAPLPDGSLKYLVVDFRANPGGDFTFYADALKWIPDKVTEDGHVYILVGSQTFSAAVNGTALLKYYGGERSSIIGTPMGDREQYWSEWGLPFRLPNAGFQVYYTTGYHDWANGCSVHPFCFTQVRKHGVAAGSLAPDVVIEPNYSDYAAGRDVVMEWVYQQELR